MIPSYFWFTMISPNIYEWMQHDVWLWSPHTSSLLWYHRTSMNRYSIMCGYNRLIHLVYYDITEHLWIDTIWYFVMIPSYVWFIMIPPNMYESIQHDVWLWSPHTSGLLWYHQKSMNRYSMMFGYEALILLVYYEY